MYIVLNSTAYAMCGVKYLSVVLFLLQIQMSGNSAAASSDGDDDVPLQTNRYAVNPCRNRDITMHPTNYAGLTCVALHVCLLQICLASDIQMDQAVWSGKSAHKKTTTGRVKLFGSSDNYFSKTFTY